MAQRLAASKPDALLLRVLSASVMAPLAVVAAWLGGALLAVIALLAAGGMGWEWGRLTQHGRFGGSAALVTATEVVSALIAVLGWTAGAIGVLALGAVARLLWPGGDGNTKVWAGIGTFWIGAGCIGLLWLGADPAAGATTLLWLFAVVWATDSAAYLVGRWAGGPRLAPRWSPKKTWSGALGGIAAAGLVGLITSNILGFSLVSPVFWASMGLSAVAQAGDLAESAAKRRFGVKDTSGLIPGHGGLLDRLDGLLAALVAAAILTLARGATPVMWS
jgi:phosphatidate cytidylyltransferase